jgi:arylsulfatase A-like enzyme
MPASSSRHVLLVTADQWPSQLLGSAGHPVVQTPTLDALARSGLRFTRAYSECPVCIPARRTLMTGVSPRRHGDRSYLARLPMPEGVTTLAQAFRNAGYQTGAVGKLHVYPTRARIGFDEVILSEEGRGVDGVMDDYEVFLGDRGFAGQYFAHGLANNGYETRSWHLPEDVHPTNWATREMVRMLRRRDPTKPGFWHLSYVHPHPPLAPLQAYVDLYRDIPIDEPVRGNWNYAPDGLPRTQLLQARRAFYALCTHIDHQLRLVIATLREEGLLDDTVIAFSSDHGEMLGNHGWWAKRRLHESAASVPLIVCGAKDETRFRPGFTDDRLVAWRDLMPTLLDLVGLPVPDSVEGISAIGPDRREHLYGECNEGANATRMIHDGRFKLIYYAAGNRFLLFDLHEDPQETTDLSTSVAHAGQLERLRALLAAELYGGDERWVSDGRWIGLGPAVPPAANGGVGGWRSRMLNEQRGLHWPPPSLAAR